MEPDLLALAAELGRRGEPFALATVVRCERPTAVKPGAKAVVHADGTLSGWIGGACAEPTVVREALAALRDGQPRLISLVGEGSRSPGRTEGVVQYPMTCHSGGTLEIYVEPFLPRPALLLLGHGPVLDTLAALGRATRFDVTVVDVAALGQSASLALTANTFVVVATHGTADEEALAQALASDAVYVSLVASRRRAAAVLERLKHRGLAPERLGALKAPAGLDIGALGPEEIAISIMAEIVQVQRSAKVVAATEPATPREAIDPICGMSVDVASARYRSVTPIGVVYFCCASCQAQYDRKNA
ncbi:MAG TPA: XdhC family protein [Methylomirabilota bacterium]|nr:XdhC family protein [Methylomirabilota bacterium]